MGALTVVVWTYVIVSVVRARSADRRREAERRDRELAAVQRQVDRLAGELRRAQCRASARADRMDARLTTHLASHTAGLRSRSDAPL